LVAEILVLRHQINIQRRHLPKRQTFSAMDRLISKWTFIRIMLAVECSTIWDEGFSTDHDAYSEFYRTLEAKVLAHSW
jgi:hypothetical protein